MHDLSYTRLCHFPSAFLVRVDILTILGLDAVVGTEDQWIATASSAECNPNIGTFSTDELRSWRDVRAKTSKVFRFPSPYRSPPGIPIGLSMLDVGCDANIRIQAYANKVQNSQFEVHIDSWRNTSLYAATCAWLEIAANDPDFQFGRYSTPRNDPWDQPEIHNAGEITFSPPYHTPPLVVVWLTELDMSKDRNWCVRTFATNVTKSGFTIHLDTWGGSLLYSGTVTWIAYRATRSGIASGHFSTLDIHGPKHPQRNTTGYKEFGANVFTSPPRVVVALDSFDVDRKDVLRLVTRTSSVTATGMTWHLDTWEDSVLYSAGASYIALES